MPSIPFSAYDPRLPQYWLRGTIEPTLVAEVPPELRLDDLALYREKTGRMRKLAHLLHSCRAAAKRDKADDWQTLYRAILRITSDPEGRVVRLVVEPRSLSTEDLLVDPGAVPVKERKAPTGPVPDDILVEVFGPIQGEASNA